MKWGRKKPSSSASSSSSPPFNTSSYKPSLISNVLPATWLTKFKRMSSNSSGQDSIAEAKPNGRWNSVYTSTLRCADGGDDAFWRLSFREEAVGGSNGNGSVLRSVWYHNHCEHDKHRQARDEGESRGFPRGVEVSTKAEEGVGEKVVEIRTPRLRVESGKKLSSRKQRGNSADHKLLENVQEEGTRKVRREDYNLVGSNDRTSMDGCLWDDEEPCEGETSPEWRKLKEMKIEEIRQRKTLYISREVIEKQRPKHKAIKVKSYSPRLAAAKAETCRVRALDEMKRSRLKSMKRKEKRKEGLTLGLDSVAVVKTSLDPQKDFRDSMMEMIKEQGISRPEELEELLACYLTLNCDDYHELIIKVFRQVWFDMNQPCNYSELETEKLFL